MKIKYALIGCGRIAKNHILAAKNNDLEIVALCDIDFPKISGIIQSSNIENGEQIGKYRDYKTLVFENKLDIVAIATESGKHAEIALFCIENRINVIIEKPMAMSMEDAQRIIDASKKYNVKVTVCHQNRFNLAIQKTREALENGRFGKLSHGTIQVRWNRNRNYYDQALWRGTWEQDGGALMNQCIHGIDLLIWMFGNDVSEVVGVTQQRFHDYIEGEDLGFAILKFENGSTASVEGTTNVFPENLEEKLCIFGETGTVVVGGTAANHIDVWNFSDNKKETDDFCLKEITSNIYGNGHTKLYTDFIEAIKFNRDPYVNAEAGMKALEVVLAIYKSSLTRKPVKLPLKGFASTSMKDFFSKRG